MFQRYVSDGQAPGFGDVDLVPSYPPAWDGVSIMQHPNWQYFFWEQAVLNLAVGLGLTEAEEPQAWLTGRIAAQRTAADVNNDPRFSFDTAPF